MSPRRSTALALTAIAASALAPASASAARTDRCTARGSITVLANDQARFYSVKSRGGTVYYGCRYRTNRRVRLATATGGCNDDVTSIANPRLAGRFVAFVAVAEGCSDSDIQDIVRVDLASRKRKQFGPIVGATADERFDFIRVESLALDSGGTVAWIGGAPDRPDDSEFARQVGVLRGRDSEPRRLDSGSGIEAGSLGLSATRVYWTKDGIASSFALR